MSRINILIEDFKYPPETIKDGNLHLSLESALASYEPTIAELCRKLPPFWKRDAIQELRLCVIQAYRRSQKLRDKDGKRKQILSETMIQDLADRLRRMEKLERNRGMTDSPEILDHLELAEHIKSGYYHEPDRGRKLRIHNHL